LFPAAASATFGTFTSSLDCRYEFTSSPGLELAETPARFGALSSALELAAAPIFEVVGADVNFSSALISWVLNVS
jgi:hypothetical protein